MFNRIIKSRAKASSIHLAECLSSLLALELLVPGPELYLISPWISEVTLISNRFGQFRAVLSESSKDTLGLSAVLAVLAERGVLVRILCRPNQAQTEDFLRRLPATIQWRYEEMLHEKGLIGHQFYLRGSMNFTYSGINLNDESVELTTAPDQVALALTEARKRWEDAVQ